MAGGHGPAPVENRAQVRTRHAPQRGEWVDLPQRNPKRSPAMPPVPRGGWSAGTKFAWKHWWEDPASLQWSPADREAVRALAYLHHDVERGKSALAGEVRLRMDGLGLTQKGKRDLRWRIVSDEVGERRQESAPAAARRQRLKVV